MFWGTELEDTIVDMWQYWDGVPGGYIANFRNNNLVRKRHRVNGVIINDKYPWLFANVDALMNKGAYNLITGDRLKDGGIIEAKNTTKYFLSSYDGTVPDPWKIQTHIYMIVTEKRYSEVAMLVDNKEYVVHPVEYDEDLANTIINYTKSFWYDRVVPAREYVDLKKKHPSKEDYYQSKIIELEPEPENSRDYMALMSEKYEEREFDDSNKLYGNDKDYCHAVRVARYQDVVKDCNNRIGESKAYFAERFRTLQNKFIHFENGKVHYRRTKGNRTPVVTIDHEIKGLDEITGKLHDIIDNLQNGG